MGSLLQEVIQNAGLILALALVYHHVGRRLHRVPPVVAQLITGCLFGVFAVAGALLPYRLSPDLAIDGRVVVVAASGMFGGWLPALVTAGFAILPTVLIAGSSATLFEICLVLTAAVAGVLVYWRCREQVFQFRPLLFFLFGLFLFLIETGWRLAFPETRASLPDALPILVLMDVVGFGALGAIIAHQFRRKNLNDSLQKSETRYRKLFEESIDAIVVSDRDGTIMSANPAAGRLVGQPDLDKLIGANTLDFYNNVKDREPIQEAIEREGFLRNYELPIRKLDGTSITCLASTVVRRDPTGKITGYLNILRDITDQKHIQQLLEKSEARFREIFERAAFGVVLADRKGRALESNPAFQKMVGYNADELHEMSFTAYTHPDDIDRNWTFFEEMFAGQTERYQIDKRFICKDGKVIWARLAVSLIKGSDGQDDHVLTVSEDITEQRRVQDALSESEQRFSRLAYHSPDAISIVDIKSSRVVFFNRNEFLGYSREEVEQGVISDSVHPDDLALVMRHRKQAIEEEEGEELEPGIEFRLKRKDGEWEWIEQRTTILEHTADGSPAQVLLTLRVITERKQTEQVLLSSQNELMARSASLTALNAIADTVHRSLDFQTVANRAMDSLMEYTGAPGALILDLDLKTGKLNMISSRGTGDPTQSLSLIISLNRLAATSQQIIFTDDLSLVQQVEVPSTDSGNFKSVVCIPLVFQQETLGTITLFFGKGYQPPSYERETLLAVGRTIALAIVNARQVARIEAEVKERQRAEEAERKQRALAEALTDITTTLTGTLDLDEVLERILADVGQVVLHDAGCIMLIEGDDARVVRHRGYPENISELLMDLRVPLETANIKYMLETGEPCVIPDVRKFAGWIRFHSEQWLFGNVCAPIRLEDEVIGFISLDSAKSDFFSRVDADRLQAFANQAAVAIRNARLYAGERKQLHLAKTLQSVGALLTSQMSLEEVLNRIFDLLAEAVPYDSVSVQLYDSKKAVISGFFGRGFPDMEASSEVADVVTEQTFSTRWRNQDVIVVPDTTNDDRWVTWEGYPNAYIKSWVGAALRVKGELIGTLNVDSSTPNVYDESTANTVLAFANQAAIAIQNARLYESERKQLQLSQTLQEVGSLLTSQMSLDDVFERIFDLLARVINYDSVGIHLLEGDKLQVISGRGYPDMTATREAAEKVVSHTVKERWVEEPVMVISDTWADERWVLEENMPNRYIRSWVGAALRVKGELIGTLNVDSATPKTYDESILDTVLAFANQAAIAIQNARLFAESQEHNRQLALLNELTRIGTSTLGLHELTQMLVNTVAKLLQTEECYIALWDEEHKRVVLSAVHGSALDRFPASASEPGAVTLTESVLELRHPLVIEKIDQSSYINSRYTEGHRTMPVVAFPLQTKERNLGALILAFREPYTFTDDFLAWAAQVANLVALAVDKAKTYVDLEDRVEERTGELRSLSIRLLELTRLKDEFVSNVSHELRTPITSIKLYHHLLKQRPERYAIYLERLERESERLEFIVEDLLYLSRMEQGQLPINSVITDLNKLIDMYFIDRKLLIEQEGHQLVINLADDLPIVSIDQMLMERVLNILVDNALKYTPEGEQITVSTGTDKEWILLRVSDTGPGIPPEELPYLFERFFRGEASRRANVPGTGLGLSIAKEIVDRHKGRIDVSSPTGEGATFTIRLPAADEESS